MNKSMLRRIEKLERTGMPAWLTTLRAVARRLGNNEEKFLLTVKGHERELAEASTPDGKISWEGFQVFYGLMKSHGSSKSVAPSSLPGPDKP